jgi:hypothetical protein
MFNPSSWSLSGRDDLPPDLLAAHNAATYCVSIVDHICKLAGTPNAEDSLAAGVKGLRRVLQEDEPLIAKMAIEFDATHDFRAVEFWEIVDSNVHALALKLAFRLKSEIWRVADLDTWLRAGLDSSAQFEVETVRNKYEAISQRVLELKIPTTRPLQALLNQEIAAVLKNRQTQPPGTRLRKNRSTVKKRGRPKDPEVARRRARMVEAWEAGGFRTYLELAQEFQIDESEASRVIKEHKRKKRKLK